MASQDWPEVTKYAGMVSAQAHRQEIIQDLLRSAQVVAYQLKMETRIWVVYDEKNNTEE